MSRSMHFRVFTLHMDIGTSRQIAPGQMRHCRLKAPRFGDESGATNADFANIARHENAEVNDRYTV